jgi:hypothetical protein
MNSIAQIRETLQTVLVQAANRLARQTGFIQREVKWCGYSFIQTLMLGFLADPDASYSKLSQIAAAVGVNISNQGLEQRFTKRAADFVYAVLQVVIAQVVCATCNPYRVLDSFRGVYIRDSSVISLPRSLIDVWRGVGNQSAETAALKLHVSLNFQTGQMHGPIIQEGRAHDQTSVFQTERLPAGALHLADLGYFNLDRLTEDDATGVFWITRLKLSTNVFAADGQPLDLEDWLTTNEVPVVERQVYLGQKHRLPCRLIAARLPQEVADRRRQSLKEWARKKQKPISAKRLKLADWTVVVTNVPEGRLSAHAVLTLLRVRWQIELLFKVWKSYLKVDEWRSQNPWRILCEIYAKLIGACMSQWLIAVSLWPYPDRSVFQATSTIQQWAIALAVAMQDPAQLLATLTALCNCLAAGCRQQKRKKHPATFQQLLSLR